MWLEHLLGLSMLQNPDDRWRWACYSMIHPAANSDMAGACARYSSLLRDTTTFAPRTLESLIDADVLPQRTARAFRKRYLSD